MRPECRLCAEHLFPMSALQSFAKAFHHLPPLTFPLPFRRWDGATISFAPAHLTLCSCQNEFKLSHDDKSCAAKGIFDHSEYAQAVPSWDIIINARMFAHVERQDRKYWNVKLDLIEKLLKINAFWLFWYFPIYLAHVGRHNWKYRHWFIGETVKIKFVMIIMSLSSLS